jgi:hypothetical protein
LSSHSLVTTLSLSALIAEAEKSTSSLQYLQAHDSFYWLRSHLTNATVNLIRYGVKIGSEDNCYVNGGLPADGTRWFVEGTSVLKDIQTIKEPEVELE